MHIPKISKSFLLIFISFMSLNLSSQTTTYSRVLIKADSLSMSSLSSLGLPLEGYFARDGYITELPGNSLGLLLQHGFNYDVLIEDVQDFYERQNEEAIAFPKSPYCQNYSYTTPSLFSLGSMGGYHTYDELLDELDSMHAWFPQLITARMPLDTFNTIEGRPVYWMRISNNPTLDQGKPKILYNALTHAREPASMQQMLFFMYYIMENYNINQDITNIVDNFELYFIPCVNPDGYIYNETTNPNGGGMWRKNRRNNGNGTFGVDLNRNFGYMWGYDNAGSSPDGSSDTYRGTGPFSEPETRMLKSFSESKNFSVVLNCHTYTNLLLYPFGYAPATLTNDSLTFKAFAEHLTSENRFSFGTAPEVLGYMGNGDANDWMYGEQLTKDKIISFTPEIGAPAYGFWPPATEIEDICKSMLKLNIKAAYLAGKYAEITDRTDMFVSTIYDYFTFDIQNLGLDSQAVFTVSFMPFSPNVLYTGSPKVYNNLAHLESRYDSIGFELFAGVTPGEDLVFLLTIDNGQYLITDTIYKKSGHANVVVYEDGSTLSSWQPGGWGLSTTTFYSPPSSITDSPSGNYAQNTTKEILLDDPIDLTGTTFAVLRFMAKWDMAYQIWGSYYDYVQALISTDNGTTWTPLCGKYTTPSNNSAIVGQPAYEMLQEEWVQEEITLDNFTGNHVRFKFKFRSDMLPWAKTDGFYFDDFTVMTADSMVLTGMLTHAISAPNLFIYPNPVQSEVNILTSGLQSPLCIKLYNTTGGLVHELVYDGTGTYKLNTEFLPEGLYVVIVTDNLFEYKTGKFMKIN